MRQINTFQQIIESWRGTWFCWQKPPQLNGMLTFTVIKWQRRGPLNYYRNMYHCFSTELPAVCGAKRVLLYQKTLWTIVIFRDDIIQRTLNILVREHLKWASIVHSRAHVQSNWFDSLPSDFNGWTRTYWTDDCKTTHRKYMVRVWRSRSEAVIDLINRHCMMRTRNRLVVLSFITIRGKFL